VGKGSEWIAANSTSENYGLGSREANDVSSSAKKDRGVSKGTLG
jgi:hypothetical protein